MKFERRVLVTYKLLQLGSNTRDYVWTFHPGSLFLSNIAKKMIRIFMNVLEGRRIFMACKLLQLEPNIRDYDWIFPPGNLFLPTLLRRGFESWSVKEKTNIYGLQALTA